MTGIVYLIAAGPGGRRSLPLAAAEVLARADYILYDEPQDAGVLALAKAARKISSGSAARGNAMAPDKVARLLIRKAGLGETVVRLAGAGADFSHVCKALRRAEIPHEVIPAAAGEASWYRTRPLAGKKVLVLGAAEPSGNRVTACLEELGAEVREAEVWRAAPPPDGFAAADRAIRGLVSRGAAPAGAAGGVQSQVPGGAAGGSQPQVSAGGSQPQAPEGNADFVPDTVFFEGAREVKVFFQGSGRQAWTAGFWQACGWWRAAERPGALWGFSGSGRTARRAHASCCRRRGMQRRTGRRGCGPQARK